ncbi:MAG: hypothetical protein GY849_02360 [Deltaproteobacteria bacterium]|nr:hypothetical protein [Deltaproteobacteria bacterium]
MAYQNLDEVGGITSGSQTFSGDKTFADDVNVNGDLDVSGTTTTLDTETVLIKDNILVLNNGETGAGVTSGISGIEVDRGPATTNYQFLFNETDDAFEIGEVGSLQKVATREDAPNDKSVAFWNNTNKNFETSSNLIFDGSKLDVKHDATHYASIEKNASGGVVKGVGGGGFEISSFGDSYLNGGNVGIGVAPAEPLHVYHATNNTVAKFESGDSSVLLKLKDNTTTGDFFVSRVGDSTYFYTANVTRLTIDSSGRLWSPPTYSNTTASTANMYVHTDGKLYRSTSTRKIKKEIAYNIDSTLALQFKPASFKEKATDKPFYGFIAEDMRYIDKKFVNGDKELPGLEMNAIVSALTATVQDLNKQMQLMKKEIESLKI